MGAALIDNVSDTAFWIAHYRGLEGERADALFHDPLAALLAGERGKAIARSMPGSYFTAWSVALRTRIIDDFIRLAIGEGAGAKMRNAPFKFAPLVRLLRAACLASQGDTLF